jgi:hypothetical protein
MGAMVIQDRNKTLLGEGQEVEDQIWPTWIAQLVIEILVVVMQLEVDPQVGLGPEVTIIIIIKPNLYL